MNRIQIEPLDSLFFRDGRPYDQGESGQAGVPSGFPPSPSVLVGAIRAACARAKGWKQGDWNQIDGIRELLGDRDDLSSLRFRGPLLIREKGGAEEVLFPVPAHLMGRKRSVKRWYPSVPNL